MWEEVSGRCGQPVLGQHQQQQCLCCGHRQGNTSVMPGEPRRVVPYMASQVETSGMAYRMSRQVKPQAGDKLRRADTI